MKEINAHYKVLEEVLDSFMKSLSRRFLAGNKVKFNPTKADKRRLDILSAAYMMTQFKKIEMSSYRGMNIIVKNGKAVKIVPLPCCGIIKLWDTGKFRYDFERKSMDKKTVVK